MYLEISETCPDEQVRRLQQPVAELQRNVKYCAAQLQLHSKIVGPVKRLVEQITSGGVVTQLSGFDTLKLQADGAVGEVEFVVFNGLVALETADTGDHWAPHRFARYCDCARVRATLLKSAPGSSQMITVFLFCELSDESAQHSRRPCQHEMLFSCVWVKRDMFFTNLFFGVSVGELYCCCFFSRANSRC